MTLTKKELNAKLAELGYKIDEESSFNYHNALNEHAYNARACYIVEADTGISFAHYKDARRDTNFDKLQAMRLEEFVIRGRVYEL